MQTGLNAARHEAGRPYRILFLVAALFDMGLGLAFLVAAGPIFAWLGATALPEPAYVHLVSGFIAAQGLGYALVWRHLWRNVDLVWVGIVFKLVYIGAAVGSMLRGDLPHAMFAWFALIDALFIVGFLLFLRTASEVQYQNRVASRSGMALDPSVPWRRDG